MLVYGWVKSHFSHATVTVLWNCFSPGFLHKPSFFHINIHWWFLLKKMQERWNSLFSLESGVLPLLLLPTQTKPQGQKATSSMYKLLWSPALFPPALWWPRQGPGEAVQPRLSLAQSCTQSLKSSSARALQLSWHGAGRWEHLWEATNLVPTHEGEGRSLISLSAIPMATNKLVQSRNWCTTKPEEFPFPPRGREGAEQEPDLVQLLLSLRGCASLAHGLGCPAVLLSTTPFSSWL